MEAGSPYQSGEAKGDAAKPSYNTMESKQAHLQMIQGVINRLSTNSFLLKGWTVVLVSALFALAAKDSKPLFVYLAYFPAFAFWALDGFFLWQERLYRALYDAVRLKTPDEIDFSMDTRGHRDAVSGWLGTTFSKTLVVFHGTVVFTVLVVMFVVLG